MLRIPTFLALFLISQSPALCSDDEYVEPPRMTSAPSNEDGLGDEPDIFYDTVVSVCSGINWLVRGVTHDMGELYKVLREDEETFTIVLAVAPVYLLAAYDKK